MSWTTSRDRLAEFTTLLALVSGTLARIGNEVYQLQRPEIGELREPSRPGSVSSITMPHKRNPETAEHLVTLWRLIRALPDRQRAVLVLRYYEDLDDVTIAQILDCSPVTVRPHAMRAPAQLRERCGAPATTKGSRP